MRAPNQLLLIACYELGHQPLSIAWPAAFLERAGYHPALMDLSVEPFDADKIMQAHLIAVSVPMHTALRIGVAVAKKMREINPTAHICFYGHYAALNAAELLNGSADSVLAGEIEEELVSLVRDVEAAGGGAAGAAADSVGFDRRVPRARRTAAQIAACRTPLRLALASYGRDLISNPRAATSYADLAVGNLVAG